MSSNDWWSRQLSGSPAPAPSRSTPPVTPPMRNAIRLPQAPQQVAVAASPTFQVTQQEVLDPRQDPSAKIPMGEAIKMWKGGEAHRRDAGNCPECGSHLYFSRAKGTMVNGASPAPRCYECGYNERYTQADQSNWAV
jgi:hypothetical protein